jgi:predicted dehydrogenase
MGGAHLRNLLQVPEAQIVAICDRDEARLNEVAGPPGMAKYTDGARMLGEADLDAVYICVPPHTHEDLEIRVAERRLPLFVEKPVSLYPEQAWKAWEALRKAGALTQVGYQMRYSPVMRQLKTFLADKTVGLAHAARYGGAPNHDWWRRYDQGGGQLHEMATHHVDLLRWVMGEVVAVSAAYSFDRLFKGDSALTVPDSQSALLVFASGATATFSTSCSCKAWSGGIDFTIEDAMVSLRGDALKLNPEGAYELPPLPEEMPNIDTQFIRAVATGDHTLIYSPYQDALKTAAVTWAANHSAENGSKLVRVAEMLG